jgi:hypothetical protein
MDIKAERVLQEAAIIAFNDPARFFDADGNLLPVTEMPEEARRALAGIEVEELYDFVPGEGRTPKGRVSKIRIRDKMPGILALGKHLGLFKDRVEIEDINVTEANEARAQQLALLRAMDPEDRALLRQILERATARLEASKNGKPAIETTATPVDDTSPRNRQ